MPTPAGMPTCPKRVPPSNSSWWADSNYCKAVMCFAGWGGCPSNAWKDATAVEIAKEGQASASEPLVLVNAGANKGYAVAEFAQRFGGAAFSAHDWLGNLTDIKPNMVWKCGFCGACRSPQPQSHANGLMKIHAHAVEILPSNVLVLQDMFRRMRIPGTVHALAFSNYTGSAYRSRFFRTGQEDSGVRASAEGHSVPMDCTTVDEFASRHNVRHIHHLALDAEGSDMRILRGAESMLRQSRISLLEFEFSPKKWMDAEGMWGAAVAAGDNAKAILAAPARDLARTVGWLHRLGYTCFCAHAPTDTNPPLSTATARSTRTDDCRGGESHARRSISPLCLQGKGAPLRSLLTMPPC